MATFPGSGVISAALTEGELKGYHEADLAAAKQLPGAQPLAALIIAAGSITPVQSAHSVDTEAAAAADDLTHLAQTVLPEGSIVTLRVADAARVVTVKHGGGGVGQILLVNGADLILNNATIRLWLERDGVNWRETHRSYGSAAAAALAFFGAQAVAEDGFKSLPAATKAADYTVVAGDVGKLLIMNSATAKTFTLPAFAAVGDGAVVAFRNIGVGACTLDGDGAEEINGAITLVLAQGEEILMSADKTNSQWRGAVIGGAGGGGGGGKLIAVHRTVNTANSSLNTCASGGSPVGSDLGVGNPAKVNIPTAGLLRLTCVQADISRASGTYLASAALGLSVGGTAYFAQITENNGTLKYMPMVTIYTSACKIRGGHGELRAMTLTLDIAASGMLTGSQTVRALLGDEAYATYNDPGQIDAAVAAVFVLEVIDGS